MSNYANEPCERWWGEKHLWEKWEILREGTIVANVSSGLDVKKGEYFIQQRKCSRCGHIERERKNTYNYE